MLSATASWQRQNKCNNVSPPSLRCCRCVRPRLLPRLLCAFALAALAPRLRARIRRRRTAQALLFGLLCLDDRYILIPDTVRSCYEAYTIYSFYNFIEGARRAPDFEQIILGKSLWSVGGPRGSATGKSNVDPPISGRGIKVA